MCTAVITRREREGLDEGRGVYGGRRGQGDGVESLGRKLYTLVFVLCGENVLAKASRRVGRSQFPISLELTTVRVAI